MRQTRKGMTNVSTTCYRWSIPPFKSHCPCSFHWFPYKQDYTLHTQYIFNNTGYARCQQLLCMLGDNDTDSPKNAGFFSCAWYDFAAKISSAAKQVQPPTVNASFYAEPTQFRGKRRVWCKVPPTNIHIIPTRGRIINIGGATTQLV